MAKILVVEDEPSLQKLLEYQLTRIGHDIVIAPDGKQAIGLVRSERPDLVLLDVMLPVMGGFQVLKSLQEDDSTSSIPVIMLSAKGQQHDIAAGIEKGVFDYITKPFNIPHLAERIQAALASVK
jgi:DNA-binding response OmpR family regulator